MVILFVPSASLWNAKNNNLSIRKCPQCKASIISGVSSGKPSYYAKHYLLDQVLQLIQTATTSITITTVIDEKQVQETVPIITSGAEYSKIKKNHHMIVDTLKKHNTSLKRKVEQLNDNKSKILEFMEQNVGDNTDDSDDGVTQHEIAQATNLSYSTVCRYLKQLVADGTISEYNVPLKNGYQKLYKLNSSWKELVQINSIVYCI